jgi:uncharacterized protein (DUF4213/DUF364 family)
MITHDILNTIEDDALVEDVWIGVHWTAVALADGRCGMASTLADDNHHREDGRAPVQHAGRLQTHSALALAAYANNHTGPEASVGWATINALVSNSLDSDNYAEVELDAADYLLQHGAGRHVAVVGHFPFTKRLRAGVSKLSVLELDPSEGDLPASAAPEILPQVDVAAITSLTLVNGSFEMLMKYIRKDTPVLMLGPSTPLSAVLFAHGIDALSGVRITDALAVRRTITQGATFPQVRGIRKVTITRR